MDELLEIYDDFDRQAAVLAHSPGLRRAAEQLARLLPPTEVVLLARTEAAIMVCAACAIVRDADTRVERAPFGRTDWAPPIGAILVEPVPPMPGLTATIRNRWPSLDVLVLSGDPIAYDRPDPGSIRVTRTRPSRQAKHKAGHAGIAAC